MSPTAKMHRQLALGGITAGALLVAAVPASAQDRYVFADLADKVSPAVVNIFTTTP